MPQTHGQAKAQDDELYVKISEDTYETLMSEMRSDESWDEYLHALVEAIDRETDKSTAPSTSTAPEAICDDCGFTAPVGDDAWDKVDYPPLGTISRCVECGSTKVYSIE